MKFPDVMVDLETAGNRPHAPITAIGAVSFDARAGLLGETFYAPVDLRTSAIGDAKIDPDTFLWWLEQSEPARRGITDGERLPISVALCNFTNWLHEKCAPQSAVRIWGNGAAFDNVILAETYRRAGLLKPWMFWNDRCFRTMKAMYPNIDMARTGTHHNALDDAISQAEHLIHIRKTLRGESRA